MTAQFWNRRRVFLTGHTGFKGGWLALSLQHAGAEVAGYALAADTQPNLFSAAGIAQDMSSQLGDVRDAGALSAAVRAHRPEVIFHLAAQALVRASYRDPLTTYSTNVMGTANVLEAARHCPEVQAVVVVTSDKCYESREWVWGYRETDALGGHDPYSNSKSCAELVTAAYRDSFFGGETGREGGARLATARAGNVIGGGDWAPERLIPDAIRSFTRDQPVELRHPEAVRPWQHVLEPVGGYMRLAQRMVEDETLPQGAWNFGPDGDDVWPVARVLEHLAGLWGRPHPGWLHRPAPGMPETGSLQLDSSKARRTLGWHPTWSLARGLEATAAWYKEFGQGGNMRGFTLQQIEEFWQSQAPTRATTAGGPQP